MRNFSKKYIILALFVILLIVFFDQMTKYWALHNLNLSRSITFFLSFTLSFNKGVSFGMFNNSETSQIILVIISLSIVIVLLMTMNTYTILPYALISGGAIGNVIDRLRISAVVDFIHLHYRDYHFPIFNIADIAICFGCSIVILLEIFQSGKNRPNSNCT